MDQTLKEGILHACFTELAELCKPQSCCFTLESLSNHPRPYDLEVEGEHKGFLSPFSGVGFSCFIKALLDQQDFYPLNLVALH